MRCGPRAHTTGAAAGSARSAAIVDLVHGGEHEVVAAAVHAVAGRHAHRVALAADLEAPHHAGAGRAVVQAAT